MSDANTIISLRRNTKGLMVPSGSPIMLHQGTEVKIMQSKGDAFTINVYGNMVRIDAKDADALGKEVGNPLNDLPKEASIKDKVWTMLKTVFDPEIPVNIVDLGLIYDCEIEKLKDGTHHVIIDMTLTAPGCGMGPVISGDAQKKIEDIPEVSLVEIKMVFDPPWDREMMSEAAQLELGML